VTHAQKKCAKHSSRSVNYSPSATLLVAAESDCKCHASQRYEREKARLLNEIAEIGPKNRHSARKATQLARKKIDLLACLRAST
jgi:hypothetical protein